MKTFVDRRMTYLALELSMDRLFRVSNVAAPDTGCNDHAIRSEDLRFIFRLDDGELDVLTVGQVRTRAQGRRGLIAFFVTSYTSKTNASGLPEDGISGGEGAYAQRLLCDMYEFCVNAGGSESGLVFERDVGGRTKKLTPHMVRTAIKEAAVGLGLDPTHFGTQSPRKAGTGVLEALQEELAKTKERGGWTIGSKMVERVYARLALQHRARGPLRVVDEADQAQRAQLIGPAELKVAGAVRASAGQRVGK